MRLVNLSLNFAADKINNITTVKFYPRAFWKKTAHQVAGTLPGIHMPDISSASVQVQVLKIIVQ